MNPKRIGFLGFDNVNALDLVGPSEAFSAVRYGTEQSQGRSCYEVLIIGLTANPFVAESGIVFRPHTTIKSVPDLDTLIIPGGIGLRHPATCEKLAAWVRGRAGRLRRVVSVCTGIYGLAQTGLLDGRRVTTHWGFAQDVARRYPKLKVLPDALFIKDGPFYTSAGITAGIDLALALIEEDYGVGVALGVARELVVYLKRPGGQEQYSEPLRFQTQGADPFTDLITWMRSHLDQDLSVEALAARVHLCPRQFSRKFKAASGSTPASFVEGLRLGEARRRLAEPRQPVKSIASAVGFKSVDAFRRAFERRLGISPSGYRSRFGITLQE